MDKKKLIKTVLIVIFVPTIFTISYYGFKYGKKKYIQWKDKTKTPQIP